MILHSDQFDQSTLAKLIKHDPLIQCYRTFFAVLNWQALHTTRVRPPHPEIAYVKVLLVKLCEGKPYVTQLRALINFNPVRESRK